MVENVGNAFLMKIFTRGGGGKNLILSFFNDVQCVCVYMLYGKKQRG